MRKLAVLFAGIVAWLISPPPVHSGALFQDGYLGLTQPELIAKLGLPHKVRIRMAAQRVFRYHTFEEWDTILKDAMTISGGEYVYQFTRDKVNVRYSFQFAEESTPNSDTPTLTVNLVDIEFLSTDPQTGTVESPVVIPFAVPIADLPKLVPEFKPSFADEAPTYRSNLFIILIQDQVSKDARRLVKERVKADYDWSLSYRLYTSEGFPSRISLADTVNRMEFAIDSLQFIKDSYRLTHDPMVNPFSAKAASLPPPPDTAKKKKIPVPRYAP
jgi:hypothetical protein